MFGHRKNTFTPYVGRTVVIEVEDGTWTGTLATADSQWIALEHPEWQSSGVSMPTVKADGMIVIPTSRISQVQVLTSEGVNAHGDVPNEQ